MTTDITDGFIELFQGNTSAVGTEEGGCERLNVDAFGDVAWRDMVSMHLRGTRTPVGVYPMVARIKGVAKERVTEWHTQWAVRWGCVDFDEGDEVSWAHAVNVQAVLRECEIQSWIERSRSKGYHVWVFASEWVPAVDMRRALLGACQIVEAPQREINPKQTELKDGQLGNYVRLPYPNCMRPGYLAVDTPRRVVVNASPNQWAYSMEMFVREALQKRVTPERLAQVGLALYTEPPKRQRMVTTTSSMGGSAVGRMSGLAYRIWDDGPLEGMGRGHTLYKLGCQLFEDGQHTAEEAEELLIDADTRWGKFVDRGDEHLITRMVDKIWEEA